MAVVIGSKFNPFNMQEMLAPVQMANEEHKLIEQQLGELSSKAGSVKSFINPETDGDVLEQYNRYDNDLSTQASNLLKQGLTPGVRQELINMRTRYGQEILPIEQALNTKKALVEEQRKYKMSNPSAIMSMDASQVPLSQLISNPAMTYDIAVGDDVTKRVATAISPYAKLLFTNPGEFKKINDGQFLERVFSTGLTTKDVIEAMGGRGPKAIRDIVDSAIQDTGVSEWTDPRALDIITNYANRGITAGLGQAQVQLQDNLDYKLAMQDYYSRKGKENEDVEGKLPLIGVHEDMLDYSGDKVPSTRDNVLTLLDSSKNKTINFTNSETGKTSKLSVFDASKELYRKSHELRSLTSELSNLGGNKISDIPLRYDYGVNKSKADSLNKKISNVQKDINNLKKGSFGNIKGDNSLSNIEATIESLVDTFGPQVLDMKESQLRDYLKSTQKSMPTNILSTRLAVTTVDPESDKQNDALINRVLSSVESKDSKGADLDIWEIDPITFRKKDSPISKKAFKNTLSEYLSDTRKKYNNQYGKISFSTNPQAYLDSNEPIIIMEVGNKKYAINANELGAGFRNAIMPYWNNSRANYNAGNNQKAIDILNIGIHEALETTMQYGTRPSATGKID